MLKWLLNTGFCGVVAQCFSRSLDRRARLVCDITVLDDHLQAGSRDVYRTVRVSGKTGSGRGQVSWFSQV